MATMLLAVALLAGPTHATQDVFAHPCDREILDDEQAFERNAWAHNCGYLPAQAVTWAFVYDLWVAFDAPGAPTDSDDPCSAAWGRPVELCPAVVE